MGGLQPLELEIFDRLMQRVQLPPDDRLAIVEISRDDLKIKQVEISRDDLPETRQAKQSQVVEVSDCQPNFVQASKTFESPGSLRDCVYDQLLKRLEQYEVKTIGLDITRINRREEAFSVADDAPTLQRFLSQESNTFAACKAPIPSTPNFPGVAGRPAPPEVPPNRLGFTDAVFQEKWEGSFRRLLLSMRVPADPKVTNECPTDYSLSLKLVAHYLGVEPKVENGVLKLGETIIPTLEEPAGGYQVLSIGNSYQTFLTYRAPNGFPQEITRNRKSLSEILQDNSLAHKSIFQGRLVLIGRVDEESRDLWPTPYGNQQVAGVIMQAQAVSQILSAVDQNHQDQSLRRPFLWYLSVWQEELLLWAMFSLSWLWICYGPAQPLEKFLGLLLGMGALSCIVVWVFVQQGGWLPLLPLTLALFLPFAADVLVYTEVQPRELS